jgi:hypothetical protein
LTEAEPDLEGVALRIARVLGADGVLAGGMAVAAHGYVRATQDVDFVVRIPLPALKKRLRAEGIATTLHRGDSSEGDFSCLKGTLQGVRFDLIPPLVALDWERALEVVMEGGALLRVVDLDGLLRLKLRAHGPKDLMDAAALLLLNPGHDEPARQAAASYGVLADLEAWLADPRLRADVQGSGERRPRKKRRT